jgi:hypothetical protein
MGNTIFSGAPPADEFYKSMLSIGKEFQQSVSHLVWNTRYTKSLSGIISQAELRREKSMEKKRKLFLFVFCSRAPIQETASKKARNAGRCSKKICHKRRGRQNRTRSEIASTKIGR